MKEALKKFIKELRASSDARRNRYLWGGSAITMSVVVLLWAAYLNMNIQGVSYNTTADVADAAAQNNFLAVMKRGSAILYTQFSDFIRERLNQKKEIIISADGSAAAGAGTKSNFQSGELTPIPPQEIK